MRKFVVIVIALLGNLYYLSKLLAMEPDDEMLRNSKFVAEYDCLTEHFLIKKHFEKEEWSQAMNIIKYLESKGYADQFLTVAKAKVFVKLGSYAEALENFQKALGETYKCRLTGFKIKFASYPELAEKAIIWHYISQVNELMEKQNEAALAQAEAEDLLKKSLDLPPEEKSNNENTKSKIIKVFSVFSLHQKPLIP
jgi:tetratricopeptide (TPR) repeat protein